MIYDIGMLNLVTARLYYSVVLKEPTNFSTHWAIFICSSFVKSKDSNYSAYSTTVAYRCRDGDAVYVLAMSY